MSDVADTLAERGKSYGSFETQAEIAQELKDTMRAGSGWDAMDPDMREALDMIANKIARLCNGDPSHVDSWHDIAGYAVLVERRLCERP